MQFHGKVSKRFTRKPRINIKLHSRYENNNNNNNNMTLFNEANIHPNSFHYGPPKIKDSLVKKLSRIIFSYYFHVTIATIIILNMNTSCGISILHLLRKPGEGLLNAYISSNIIDHPQKGLFRIIL